ncbi:MAG: IS4 family transposase [Chloroflexota bacterium]|nr:IS4 family transposase [Chloroflexota bacterium]
MPIILQLTQAMQTLLTTTTEATAAALQFVKRPDRAKFTPSTLVQTLVYGWMAHPAATVTQLAQMASRVGVDIAPQALDQRFTLATATLLQQVLAASMHHHIAADPVAIPLLQRFTSVRVHDSTTISLPDVLTSTWRGCGNATDRGTAGLKCGVQIDLLTGALCGIDLVDGRSSDHTLPVQHLPLPAGSLRLADLGFYNLDVLAQIHADGGYWLSRVQSNTLVAYPGGKPQPLISVLNDLGSMPTWDANVIMGVNGQIHARLLVRRVPTAVADQRRRRIQDAAKDKGHPVSKATLALADWNVAITNVPRRLLSLAEALVLMRLRWQIELVFKLWKSHGRVDEWRTTNPARILCEIYAKLIGLVFQQWILAASSWGDPERSLFKAATMVMSAAAELASAMPCAVQIERVLTSLARMIQRLARTQKRHNPPTTAQRILAVEALAK